jgi:hypothetical protein
LVRQFFPFDQSDAYDRKRRALLNSLLVSNTGRQLNSCPGLQPAFPKLIQFVRSRARWGNKLALLRGEYGRLYEESESASLKRQRSVIGTRSGRALLKSLLVSDTERQLNSCPRPRPAFPKIIQLVKSPSQWRNKLALLRGEYGPRCSRCTRARSVRGTRSRFCYTMSMDVFMRRVIPYR